MKVAGESLPIDDFHPETKLRLTQYCQRSPHYVAHKFLEIINWFRKNQAALRAANSTVWEVSPLRRVEWFIDEYLDLLPDPTKVIAYKLGVDRGYWWELAGHLRQEYNVTLDIGEVYNPVAIFAPNSGQGRTYPPRPADYWLKSSLDRFIWDLENNPDAQNNCKNRAPDLWAAWGAGERDQFIALLTHDNAARAVATQLTNGL